MMATKSDPRQQSIACPARGCRLPGKADYPLSNAFTLIGFLLGNCGDLLGWQWPFGFWQFWGEMFFQQNFNWYIIANEWSYISEIFKSHNKALKRNSNCFRQMKVLLTFFAASAWPNGYVAVRTESGKQSFFAGNASFWPTFMCPRTISQWSDPLLKKSRPLTPASEQKHLNWPENWERGKVIKCLSIGFFLLLWPSNFSWPIAFRPKSDWWKAVKYWKGKAIGGIWAQGHQDRDWKAMARAIFALQKPPVRGEQQLEKKPLKSQLIVNHLLLSAGSPLSSNVCRC